MPRSRFSDEWQEALLDWARNMISKELNKPGPDNIENLYSGAVFSDLLVILDDEYKPDELQENLSLANRDLPVEGRQRNMHIIRKALRSFVKRQLEVVEILIDDINFQALDKNPDREGMCQILAIFLVVSVNLPDKFVSQGILQDMKKTPEDKKRLEHLMQIMNQSENRIKQGSQTDTVDTTQTDGFATAPEGTMDELAFEAELSKLHREIESLKKRNADLVTVHERLQESHQELLERHEKVSAERDRHQELLDSGDYGNRGEKEKELREKMRLIDNLERQLQDSQDAKEALDKIKVRLENDISKLVPLAQECQDLKQENIDLSKKANAAEHLKQKLEKLRGLEAEVKELRKERNAFFEGQDQLVNTQKQLAALSAERDRQVRDMSAYEVQVAEFGAQRSAWTTEYQKLQRHVDTLEIRAKHDEDMVKELQEKVLLLDPSAVADTSYALQEQPQSLEDELQGVTTDHSYKDLEVSRLQAENALLKSTIGTETEKGKLLQEIEKERDARKALQEQYNSLFEKHAVDKGTLDALINNMHAEGNEAYTNLRKQVHAEESRTKILTNQLETAQAEIKDKERELLDTRGDLNAISQGGQDALSELKKTDGLLALSLRSELDALRKKYDCLKTDFDARQEQLVSALIDKDQLRKEADAASTELQKAVEGQAVNTDVIKTTEKIEKLRIKYKQLSEQFDRSEQARYELEKIVKALRTGSGDSAQKVQQEQTIKNLQRENAMIATAWYDLTSRLQSNHVVLQRRHDAPKSWLNKQRQMVNATPRR